MRAGLLLVVALALAGCAATPAELAAADDAACVGYGFDRAAGPADYAACRMGLDQARGARADMRRAAWFAGAGTRMLPGVPR